jgi:hypothetical protein
VLIAEQDLEIEHRLAETLKAEMPWLNDTRVDGTDGHFMHGRIEELPECMSALRRRCRGCPR